MAERRWGIPKGREFCSGAIGRDGCKYVKGCSAYPKTYGNPEEEEERK